MTMHEICFLITDFKRLSLSCNQLLTANYPFDPICITHSYWIALITIIIIIISSEKTIPKYQSRLVGVVCAGWHTAVTSHHIERTIVIFRRSAPLLRNRSISPKIYNTRLDENIQVYCLSVCLSTKWFLLSLNSAINKLFIKQLRHFFSLPS